MDKAAMENFVSILIKAPVSDHTNSFLALKEVTADRIRKEIDLCLSQARDVEGKAKELQDFLLTHITIKPKDY